MHLKLAPEADSFEGLLDRVLHGSLPLGFHFQPIVDLRHAVIVGYEALARFPAEMGMPPDACLQAAELCGRVAELEDALLTKAISARHRLPANCFLSLNMSPRYLLSERGAAFVQGVETFRGIVVEITEQEHIEDYAAMRARVAAIRERGGMIAVDDAGAGYASLKHVMQLRPNFVKLDRFFVDGCDVDRSKSTLIEMIGMASNRLDAWIIAEGVEVSGELNELMRLGVPLAQGYYLGRPHADMQPLAEATAADLFAKFGALNNSDRIERWMETCPAFHSAHAAAAALEEDGRLRYATILDEWRRPVGMLERHPHMGIREVGMPMKAQSMASAQDVLQRALTRGVGARFDAIALINERGQFLGVVQVDKLMQGMLASPGNGRKR